ncbi:MAG: deoxyribose-phosphate aldolase [Malacoplasma sp.]
MTNEYSKYIDHTLLAADASIEDITKLCNEAILYNFKSVCVNPSYVKLAKKLLQDSDVLVCTVIGFPLGQNTTTSKVFETFDAIKNGADEIDMVINIAKLKADDKMYNLLEINEIKRNCDNKVLKVIIETCLLDENEKIRACNLIKESNADFIKTSTGFSKAGAHIDDIVLFKDILGDSKLIKAAGGIKTFEDLKNMVEAGANRIGTSKGVQLLTETISDSSEY